MKIAVVALLASSAFAADKFSNYPDSAPAHNVELARYINSINAGWTASVEPHALFANRTFGEAKKLMGTRLGGYKAPAKVHDLSQVNIPDSFDARTNWGYCPTISEIRDQSACGSCWAFGAAESMSDRYCVFFGRQNAAARNIRISTNNLLSCCDSCGSGCDGGYPSSAWDFWVQNGLVTETCEPYPFPACAHHTTSPKYKPCPSTIYPTPNCPSTCSDGTSPSSAPTYYGRSSYTLSGEAQFQAELMQNGPFEVSMTVYADFESYKGGIYKHVTGDVLGGHAIRIVGWGVENGVKYWTIANSWNPSWGEDGYFRIVRGVDECGIEEAGAAGLPRPFTN